MKKIIQWIADFWNQFGMCEVCMESKSTGVILHPIEAGISVCDKCAEICR